MNSSVQTAKYTQIVEFMAKNAHFLVLGDNRYSILQT